MWRGVVLGLLVGLLAAWVALVVTLLAMRPTRGSLRESVRLLPDLLRLLRDLAADSSQPRGVRWRLGGLLVYLAIPVDLVPDFLPVIGYADDVIVAVWVLRSVVRTVGVDEVRRHWRGTDDGFAAVRTVAGI